MINQNDVLEWRLCRMLEIQNKAHWGFYFVKNGTEIVLNAGNPTSDERNEALGKGYLNFVYTYMGWRLESEF